MKKFRDLLLMLPDDIACKAINNFREQRAYEFHILEGETISGAITGSFMWEDTPEGDHFWLNLYNKYQDLEENGIQTDGKIIIKLDQEIKQIN